MADFVKDLGVMLQTALRADATLQSILGRTGAITHVEYGDQPMTFPQGASGRCYLRFSNREQHADYGASADVGFKFLGIFDIVDVRGKKFALSLVAKALQNTFPDNGMDAIDAHLVDAGSNRLGGSGEVTWTLDVNPREILPDVDRPVVAAEFTVRVTHKVPLT